MAAFAGAFALYAVTPAQAETITIATVNNSDMIIMQKLAPKWEQATGNKINWSVLEENVLRQRVTTDISTKSGQYDIITIGAYETPIWGKLGWLVQLDDLGDDYGYADLLGPVKSGLSYDGHLYAVPFYAESSMTFYRKDLFEKAGLTMPDQPSWDQIRDMAVKLTDRPKEQYGICLRGKPGWGENMAFVSTLVNTYGGAWFDMDWKPLVNSDPWKKAIGFYVDLLKAAGPPGATSNGANENAALYQSGHCAIWVDATSNAGRVFDPKQSQVSDKTAFAKAPVAVTPKGAAWAWSWALGIPSSTKKEAAAKSFVKWATSKEYVKLVAEFQGWVAVPPGTRQSTYDSPEYRKAAPFAEASLNAILSADPAHPTMNPVPYTGVQFVAIPEFQAIGTTVGQAVSAALSGQQTVDKALDGAQDQTLQTMQEAGYIK
ncbi:ABC transporter substrate-binding protein [Labrys wisconsinensis]|uniref:Sorbitol/mannitol transport system substrate-binding protein n=1 Tax=Labrys wisconsinensis TaxID=425677 RepID=A0ABU0JP73_9HYPH|nr:sugar ABC transporter substrate-binding protein [Labrys wisconsinensis]MDQ0475291.1 sorbitol/mannitol transport system substrate-binding protein [Labrys wisconsinensis]